VKVAGSQSWKLTSDIAELPHVALYVRDAAAIGSGPDGALPPRLQGEIPDRSFVLDDHERARAESEWRAWWGRVIAFETDERPAGSELDTRRRLMERARQHQRVADPPAFQSLDDSPALQGAVRSLFEEARTWFRARERAWRPPRAKVFDGRVAKRAAEHVAQTEDVPMGRLRARVQLLLVEGDWWQRPSDGVMLYSPSLLADDAALEQLLRDTFASAAGLR
jgi:hypothetical protein